jgi:hypothetical protein
VSIGKIDKAQVTAAEPDGAPRCRCWPAGGGLSLTHLLRHRRDVGLSRCALKTARSLCRCQWRASPRLRRLPTTGSTTRDIRMRAIKTNFLLVGAATLSLTGAGYAATTGVKANWPSRSSTIPPVQQPHHGWGQFPNRGPHHGDGNGPGSDGDGNGRGYHGGGNDHRHYGGGNDRGQNGDANSRGSRPFVIRRGFK